MLRNKEFYVNHGKCSLQAISLKTLITPLLQFNSDLGLVCKKIYRSVEYILVKRFNKFVQSAVNARRKQTRIQTQVLSQKQ